MASRSSILSARDVARFAALAALVAAFLSAIHVEQYHPHGQVSTIFNEQSNTKLRVAMVESQCAHAKPSPETSSTAKLLFGPQQVPATSVGKILVSCFSPPSVTVMLYLARVYVFVFIANAND